MNYTVSAPGRICLFGEHQDYLGLPVIAAAIGLRLKIDVTLEDPSLDRYRIIMPDLKREEWIETAAPLAYRHKGDYLLSSVKVLREAGFSLPRALTAVVRSEIPIAAGTSSSSALIVAWISALLNGGGHEEARDPMKVARYAHKAEVIEFEERGGMMDQLSISYGGICYIDFTGDRLITPLKAKPKGFVLGDSCQPKDTQAVLSRVRRAAEGAITKIRALHSSFDLKDTPSFEVEKTAAKVLEGEEKRVFVGNLRNRHILQDALNLLSRDTLAPEELGELLSAHHQILRDNMGISTNRIEAMMEGALKAGALGGKINGSGGGGCLFVLAPGREEEAVSAMEKAGGKAYPLSLGEGVRITG